MSFPEEKTTLILGAGASRNYGFPTGYELAQALMKWPSSTGYGQAMFGDKNVYENFKDHFQDFLDHGGQTIDAFLATPPGLRFIEPARLAMSLIISECEAEDKLFDDANSDDNWYPYFYEQLTQDRDFRSLDFSKFSIITFNYDRSLECFLYKSLSLQYSPQDHKLRDKIESLDLTHVYGTIGVPWIGDGYEKYGPRSATDNYYFASQRLKLIKEGGSDRAAAHAHEKIQNSLTSAQRLCFLGFGFDETNLEVLGFRESRSYPTLKRIVATAFELSDEQLNSARLRILGSSDDGRQCEFYDARCLEVLRQSQILGGS